MDERENLIRYLRGLRDYQEEYRRGKERTAWVATALYLSALLAAMSQLPARPTYSSGLVLMIVITGVLVWLFVWLEFQERGMASRRVSAASSLLAKLVDPKFPKEGLNLNHVCSIPPSGGAWPKILKDEYCCLPDARGFPWQRFCIFAAITVWTFGAVFYWLWPLLCSLCT